MRPSTHLRSRAMPLVAALAGVFPVAMVGCGESSPLGEEGHLAVEDRYGPVPSGLLVSGPAGGQATLHGAAGTSASADVVYVSAAPGTLPSAQTVEIRNVTVGGDPMADIRVVDGGFDPVGVGGRTGDEIVIEVHATDETTTSFLMTVPDERPPAIVRTDPPDGRVDVAFSVSPRAVFTEPIDPASVGAGEIRLERAGVPLDGSAEVDSDEPFTATIVPASPLAPLTTYTLHVSAAVRDLDGNALGQDATVSFTTQAVQPTSLTIVSGDGQTGRVGTAVTDPLVVRVGGVDGDPLEGVTVVWEAYGTGALDGFDTAGEPIDLLRTRTDAQGLARASLVPTTFAVVGTGAYLPECPTTACGATEVRFSTDARDPGASVRIVSGDGQTADAGQPSAPLTLRVTDGGGAPVQHVAVLWERAYGELTLVGDSLVGAAWTRTDADGVARNSVIPLWFGPVVVEAKIDGLLGVTPYTIDASDPGASIAIVSGDGQVGKANEELGEPFVVRVTNGRGVLVERVRLDWNGGPYWGVQPPWSPFFRVPGGAIGRSLVAGLDTVYYHPGAAGPVWATASLPGLATERVRFEAHADVFVIELWPSDDPGIGPYNREPYFDGNLFDPVSWDDVGMNSVRLGWPVEWAIRVPGARIVSTSVPPGGEAFDSGPLGEDDRFVFVPAVTGTWEYVDQVTGAVGVLTVY